MRAWWPQSRSVHQPSPTKCGGAQPDTGALRSFFRMKILLWIVGIIFLIGLLVVLGIGGLIF